MDKRAAKRVAIRLVAADLNATLGIGAWDDQGLLDDYDNDDLARIYEAAHDLLAELWRRSAHDEEG